MIEITIYEHDMGHDEEQLLETVRNWGSPTSPPHLILFGRKYTPWETIFTKTAGANRTTIKLCPIGKVG